MLNLPWTRAELKELTSRLEADLESFERDNPEIRPLPPMGEIEAKEMLLALADAAMVRLLTPGEAALFGQLLCGYKMAIQAAMLGHEGRYYVFNEVELIAATMDRK